MSTKVFHSRGNVFLVRILIMCSVAIGGACGAVAGSAMVVFTDHPVPAVNCFCGGVVALGLGFMAGDYVQDFIDKKNPIMDQSEGNNDLFGGSNQDLNRQFQPHD